MFGLCWNEPCRTTTYTAWSFYRHLTKQTVGLKVSSATHILLSYSTFLTIRYSCLCAFVCIIGNLILFRLCKSLKKTTASIDFSKAFYRINYKRVVTERWFDVCYVKLLAFWYSRQTVYVSWQNCVFDEFYIYNWIRQDGVLSSYLLTWCVRLGLLTIFDWSKEWQIEFNTNKCKVMYIGNSNKNFKYHMDNKELEILQKEKDLGVLSTDDSKASSRYVQAFDSVLCNVCLNIINTVLDVLHTICNSVHDLIHCSLWWR